MADGTKIEWTDATWNPITGCSVRSPGCTNCYAMKLAGTRLKHHKSRQGLTVDAKTGPVWTGEVRFIEEWLDQPLRWKSPRMIFVCAHADLFHENVPDEWIDRVFAVMALASQHVFQVLTKRADRMRRYLASAGVRDEILSRAKALPSTRNFPAKWPLPNVWLGVSVEDQKRADERIPDLLATPAAVRWVSMEPLLGPVDLRVVQAKGSGIVRNALTGQSFHETALESLLIGPRLDWIVLGGESGRGARPMHPDWARSVRDECAAAGVPFLFKQWGAWAPGESISPEHIMTSPESGATWFDGRWLFEEYSPSVAEELHDDDAPDVWNVGKRNTVRLLDGITHDGFPQVAA